jgi:hypothetical protein
MPTPANSSSNATSSEDALLRDSVKDLAFAVRRIGLWARKAFPSSDTDGMVQAVEKRLSAIAARLGSE